MSSGHYSNDSPTEFSGSGSHSEATQLPMPAPEPVFADFFNGALVFKVLMPEMLLVTFPPLKVLESIEDRTRVAEIVNTSIGTHLEVIMRRYDIPRYAEDIQAGIGADPEIAKRFLEAIGVDFFLEHMPLSDLYDVVMGTGWMLKDTPQHRGFAASLCRSLVKHEAFGSTIRTLEHITSAIGIETLMSDSMPHGIRTRLFKAAYKGSRKYGPKHLCEYMFDENMGGVPFEELGEHLKVAVMGNAFASYVDMLGLVKTGVDRPSELPPPGHPSQVATPPLPAVPNPTFDSPPLPIRGAGEGKDPVP